MNPSSHDLLPRAKVQVPRRHSGTLRRPRLLEYLHQNFVERKLIFVTAPAGYGKTTLFVDFAAEVEARVCWYQITPEDRDLNRFVRYLLLALFQKYPHLENQLQKVLDGDLPFHTPDTLAGWFLSVLEEQVDDVTLLVLDDYHLVGEVEPIVEFMEKLLSRLPEHIHFLVASRSFYGIPSVALFLRNELGILGADHLRFTADELRALAQLAYGVELDPADAADLARRMDGWIVALLLAVRLRKGQLPMIRGERAELYNFLAKEVFQQLQPPLQRFLLDTSVFTDFHEALCEAVLAQDPRPYLAEIVQRNLFVTQYDGPRGETVYRYHQLFGDFLRERLASEDPKRFRQLHHKAAAWFWQQGQPEEAVAHRLAVHDREGALPWMEAAARDLFIHGRGDVLRGWVEALSKEPDLRPRAPRVLLYYAKTLSNANRFAESDTLLTLARPALEVDGDPLSLANFWITTGFNAHRRGETDTALEAAYRAQRLLADAETPEVVLYRAQGLRLEALALFRQHKQAQAIAQMEQAAEILERLAQQGIGDDILQSQVGFNLAMALQDLGTFCFHAGRVVDAQRHFERARDLWRTHRLNPALYPALLNNLAYLYARVGDRDKAWRTYQEALEKARRQDSPALSAIISGQGELLRQEERWEETLHALQEAFEHARRHHVTSVLAATQWGMAKTYALLGWFQEVMNHFRSAAYIQNQDQGSLWYRWHQAYLFWLLGKNEEAEALLAQIEDEADQLEAEEQVRYGLLRAAFLAQQGREAAALHTLRQALSILTRLGYLHFLYAEVRKLRDFLRWGQARLQDPVLAALLRLGTSSPAIQVTDKEETAPPPRLEVYGFGLGRVFKNGEPIPPKAWRASGARALFFFILEKGEVHKEDLTLAFWPDFRPAQVTSNLHATLWRARRALGDKSFIQAQGGVYRLHPALKVDYDVHRFEALLRAAAQAPSPRQRLHDLGQAVGLYRGDFLTDLDWPWIHERRYLLQQRYREALETLIEWHMSRGECAQARPFLERGLRLDPYQERWHLHWMECLAARGAVAEALAYYQTYRERLQEELHIAPDEALQAFYARLRAQ